MHKIILTFISFILLSGCATVFSGTDQAVNVTAVDQETKQDLKDVHCTITDDEGATYQLVSNPGAVIIPKGNAPLQVKCHQNGYHTYTGVINDSFDAVTLIDILFWPTFFVDWGTGAMHKYPGSYSVVMTPESIES
ncbi:MAG: hypothetical protein ABSF18_05310 [Gammaproteobacteria bacterium]|jgi:uncharacterized protein YceK